MGNIKDKDRIVGANGFLQPLCQGQAITFRLPLIVLGPVARSMVSVNQHLIP